MYYSALIGKPTKHSVSHILYEELIKAAKLNMVYKHLKIDVGAADLKPSLDACRRLHFAGLSVTLPHKLAVMQYLDELDPVVQALGAVNTVKITSGDKMLGYNTDWIGIVESVRNHSQRDLRQAMIFGSGGAARAAIYAARELGCAKIYAFYRSDVDDEKTQDLLAKQKDLGITMLDYDQAATTITTTDIIINATSAGMVDNEPTPLPLTALDNVEIQDKVFFDAVFKPLKTPLLEYFQERGAVTIDGLWMMIYQGVAALSIWLDREIVIDHESLRPIHAALVKELDRV